VTFLLNDFSIWRRRLPAASVCLTLAIAACSGPAVGPSARGSVDANKIRIGYFPNLTHPQALLAQNLARDGKAWFEPRLGQGITIEWFAYNAGPSAMEAIFARSIDLAYVGPSPAINAYTRANGAEIRIVAGAVAGGSALVVHSDSPLRQASDFRGKRIATPQLGNTQDVAARAWLADGGLVTTLLGGDAQVIPTANADQLTLFKSKALDAVWTVEPWVARLELEARAKIIFEDRDSPTTVLAASVTMLQQRRELLRRFVAAHHELTRWIMANPLDARERVRAEIERQTRRPIAAQLIERAWPRLVLTEEVTLHSLDTFSRNARRVGLVRTNVKLEKLIEIP
jgi:NitT/TauT family transport system substrate-binding protein